MMSRPFTHEYYHEIITSLLQSGRHTGTIAEYFVSTETGINTIIRHDVDRRPLQAVHMAKLEHKLDVKSTYYFRANSKGSFKVEAIKTISSLGHEVGYHYEALSTANGDVQKALMVFGKNLENFRKIAPCSTVSMHGSPLSPYDNLELLKDTDLKEWGLIADASLSFSSSKVVYYTDIGGYWNNEEKLNRRDRVSSSSNYNPYNTPFGSARFDELLKEPDELIYLNIHPERWAHNYLNLLLCRASDVVVNFIKRNFIKDR